MSTDVGTLTIIIQISLPHARTSVWRSPDRASNVLMNNSNPAVFQLVRRTSWSQTATASVPFFLLSCPLSEGYQDSALWTTPPYRVSSKTAHPPLQRTSYKEPMKCWAGRQMGVKKSLPSAPPSPLPTQLGLYPGSQSLCQAPSSVRWHFRTVSLSSSNPHSSFSAGPRPAVCRKFQTRLYLPHTQAMRKGCTRCPDAFRHMHTPHTQKEL